MNIFSLIFNYVGDAIRHASGAITGIKSCNKFGRNTNCDLGIDTDIHDNTLQAIWLAPTEARLHKIKSTSTDDIDAGVGANTIKIYGLTSWDDKESSEIITLNGTTEVITVDRYVIIHRMKVISCGSSGPNLGIITATADIDATVTAQINTGEGQTQMAVYGIPSTQDAYMKHYYCSAVKRAASLAVKISVLVDVTPNKANPCLLVKHTIGLATEGSNYTRHEFDPNFKITGPAIIKIQANSSADNTDVSAGFDLTLIDRV